MKSFAWIVILAWIALQTSVYADHARVENLTPMVITASRFDTTLKTVPNAVTVISREDIKNQSPRSFGDLLRQVPGIHFVQPGGYGGLSEVYIRGGDPNFTAIMLDGVRLNDPTDSRGGTFDLSSINLDSIERIEIVRGPLSDLYGSGSLAGTINIITRKGGDRIKYSASTEIGSDDFFRVNLHGANSWGRSNIAANAMYFDSGEGIPGQEYVTKNINTNVDFFLGERFRSSWGLRFARNKGERFPDDSGGLDFSVSEETETRKSDEYVISSEIAYKPNEAWRIHFIGNWYKRKDEINSPGVAPGRRDPFGIPSSETDSDFERANLIFSSQFIAKELADFVVGANLRFENGDNDGVLFFSGFPVDTGFDLQRTIYGIFLESRFFPAEGLILHGGLRVDYSDEFPHKLSPNVGLIYSFSETDTTVKINWGEGYKLPSFFALGHPIVGNLDLEPEESESAELSLIQPLWGEDALLSLGVFYNRFKNMVDFDEGPPPRLVNRSEIIAKGIEFEFNYEWEKLLRWDIHATYTDINTKKNDQELRNRPTWTGGSRLTWLPTGEWRISLSSYYVGSVLDSSIPTGDRNLDAYYRLDLASRWLVGSGFSLGFAVDNLFDADYEEAVGIPGPGIQFRFNAMLSFDG